MTSNHHALYVLGDTRATMAGTKSSESARRSESHKAGLSSDWSLQLDSMKLELLVIANQPKFYLVLKDQETDFSRVVL